ncbi:MAG TPA: host attachment protein [Nevskiaceae bacterium]|nr:host attachment protein [Nevskiaceae bacterium]
MSAAESVVLVADSARARLFDAPTPTAALHEIEDLSNPVARLHEGDLVADRAGVKHGRSAQVHGGSMTAGADAYGGGGMRDHRVEEFAKSVCERLADTVRRTDAERVYIVAEPQFLGLLRARMDAPLRRRVAGEIAKSIAGKPPDEIRRALPPRL